ncbi:MAG: DUF885 domain-containing protein, partial [Methylosarcina sp.]
MSRSACSQSIRILAAGMMIGLLFAAQPISAKSKLPAWNSFVDQFIEGYFILEPTFAVSAGRHEFDGKLPDWSPAG